MDFLDFVLIFYFKHSDCVAVYPAGKYVFEVSNSDTWTTFFSGISADFKLVFT